MAEPQTTPQNQPRAREDTGAGTTAAGERRSFAQEAAHDGEIQAHELARAGEHGVRRMADAGRAASYGAAEMLRRSFDPFLAMQLDMNRWLDDLWRQTLGFRAAPAASLFRPLGQLSTSGFFGSPPADLQETEEAHVLAIELPGMRPGDIDVGVEGDMLTVCGHKAEDTENASATYRMSERRFGRFERSIPLPPDVDRPKISAQFRDGVLKITLPKDPAQRPRRARIEVKA